MFTDRNFWHSWLTPGKNDSYEIGLSDSSRDKEAGGCQCMRGKISSLVTQTSRQACDQDQQVWHHAINHLSPLPFHSQSSGLGWRCPATRHYTVISPARGWRQNTMNCVSEPPADQLQLGPGHTLKYHHRPPAQSTTGGRKLLFNSSMKALLMFFFGGNQAGQLSFVLKINYKI